MPEPSAEHLFVAWVNGQDSDETGDFEALLEAHPEHAELLQKLRSDLASVAELLERFGAGESLDERLESRFGSDAGSVELEAEPDPHARLSELIGGLESRRSGFGRYRLKEVVGRGGMGLVLRVWDTDLKRHLAMKLRRRDELEGGVPPSPRTSRSIGRFLEEAQVTGQLDHPGVIPVHELGLDASGDVYFTMRLVQGEDLGRVLEHVATGAEGWTQTRALGVLQRVCEALAYAHAKGVIHRDLKPANIMVGRFGEVYVMDWGLARVVHRAESASDAVVSDRRGSSESPLMTADGDVIGTPSYMSPEQARGELDTMGPHSDVYSMGAILYQLLSSIRPYGDDDAAQGALGISACVRAGPPTPLARIASEQPGELIAICERAMARVPGERYATVGELGDDLRAFLENRVVRAYRTGPIPELAKWVARNRALAWTSAGALLLAVGGSTTTALVLASKNETILAAKAEAEAAQSQAQADARRARSERSAADRVASFLESLFEASDPWQRELPEPPNVLTLLHAGAERIRDAPLDADPLVQARLTGSIAKSLSLVGALDEARPLAEEAYGMRMRLGGPSDPATHQAALDLAYVLKLVGSYERAEELLRQVHADRPAEGLDALRLVAADELGVLLNQTGRYRDAEPFAREAIAGSLQLSGPSNERYLQTVMTLGATLHGQGRAREATDLLRGAIESSGLGADHPLRLRLQVNLAALLATLELYDEAEALVSKCLPPLREAVGDDHQTVLSLRSVLVASYIDQGRHEEAVVLARESLDANERTLGRRHEFTIKAMSNLAQVYSHLGRLQDAEALSREASNLALDTFGEASSVTAGALHTLAYALDQLGRLDEAAELLERAVAGHRASSGLNATTTLTSRNNLLSIRFRQGRIDEVVAAVLDVYEERRRVYDGFRHVRRTLSLFLASYDSVGRFDEAVAIARELAQGPDGKPGELEWVDDFVARKRAELDAER